jgi:tRNA (guanosine-2'-O-)-methyltransferase
MPPVSSDKVPTAREAKLFHTAARRMGGLRIVLDASISDRSTVAAILRTTESFGLLHAHHVRSEKEYHTFEASAGEKWLHMHNHESLSSATSELRALGFQQIFAAGVGTGDPEGPWAIPLEQIDFAQPTAFVFIEGLQEEVRMACSGHVRLGIDGPLPLSICAAIVLHYARASRENALEDAEREGAQSATGSEPALNPLGGDLAQGAVDTLFQDYLQRGRGFKRAWRIAAASMTEPRSDLSSGETDTRVAREKPRGRGEPPEPDQLTMASR